MDLMTNEGEVEVETKLPAYWKFNSGATKVSSKADDELERQRQHFFHHSAHLDSSKAFSLAFFAQWVTGVRYSPLAVMRIPSVVFLVELLGKHFIPGRSTGRQLLRPFPLLVSGAKLDLAGGTNLVSNSNWHTAYKNYREDYAIQLHGQSVCYGIDIEALSFSDAEESSFD
ncbi:unnamed protein product [Dovyalis caffra]|uniref:Uncharacterized protein n=1 Tax=Dovyalis caffra TaxID=77055 RepID=A0AAV1QMP4_9ROSI|nr:unnamed protein product [Dovyalis caffra]